MPRKRLGKETSQELISSSQFTEFITDYGWVVYDEDPDLGEDFLIKIFRDQVPSGISFQVQLKSTKDIDILRLKDGRIRYRIDVDDLEHWDAELPPVMLVIWDISRKTGWYTHISEVTKYLDDNRPNWRNQETTTVYIPYTNSLDKNHLSKIDRYFTQKIAPIILKDKDLKINAQFSFPQDEESQRKLKQVQRFFNAGDPVDIDGKHITKWDVPDAWKRLYGEPDLEKMYIQMGPSEPKKLLPAQIDLYSPEIGSERIDYVEFYNIKGGQEQFTLSNEKQIIPYIITMDVNTSKHSILFNLNIIYHRLDAIEAKKALNIMQIMASGGTLIHKMLDQNSEFKVSFPGVPSVAPDEMFIEFIENIYQIQQTFGKRLFLRENEAFTYQDYENAKVLASIIRSGSYRKKGLVLSREFEKRFIQVIYETRKKSERLHFKEVIQESYISVLDVEFDLGPRIHEIKGVWKLSDEEVENWLSVADENDTLEIKLQDVELILEIPDWQSLKPAPSSNKG